MNSTINPKGLSRRTFLKASAMAAGSLALAACVAAPAAEQGDDAPAADAQVLAIWSFPRTEDDIANIFDPLNEEFQAENPDVDVQVEILPWGGRREKMLTAYAGGQNPDMALMQNDMLSLMGLNGVLTPLGDLIDADRLAEVPKRVVPGISWNGELIFMPFAFSADSFLWNKGLAADLGWDSEEAPQTWDDIRKLGPLAVAQNMYAWSHDNWTWSRWIELTWQAGGTVFDAEVTMPLLTEPAGVETLSFIVEMFNEGWIPPEGNVGSSEESGGVELNYFFTEEQVISPPDDTDIITAVKDELPDMDWGAVPPMTYVDNGVLASIDTWGMFNNSEAKDAGARWMSFVTRPEKEGFISSQTGISPLTEPAQEFWVADEDQKALAEVYVGVARSNQDTGWYWQEGKTVVAPQVQAAVLGQKSIEEALSDAQDGLQELIDKDMPKREG